MVYIGNQTSSWAAVLTEPFDYAVAQGFDAFEWFPDKKPGVGWDEQDLSQETRAAIAGTARSRGMRLSVHARWQADLFSAEGVTLVRKDLELARDLGAVLLNIHLSHETGLVAFIQAILPLIESTFESGLQLAIENTPHHSPEQFNDLFSRIGALDAVPTAHVGMCLDIGHANLCAATHNDYLGFYDRLAAHVPLIHLHLHENWGDADSHLPLFTGPAAKDDSGIRDLVARLKKREFSGSIILEQWPHPPSLLNQAHDRLRQLWQPDRMGSPPRAKPENSTLSPSTPTHDSETDFVNELVAGDRTRRSWREKLDFVRDLLAREQPRITSEQLIDVAIYLRFLGTGEITCTEDGRHFRPAQHARLASQIQDRLAALSTVENQFVIRKILPWLPSSAPTFRRPEPLTRIRDIAHRNDIPPDLKREIKTTLQNKLHRCAGPEDLVTSAALLERISAPGATYSAAFVEQFNIFHLELKEFFNAQSLEQRLRGIAPAMSGEVTELIEQFLKQKARSTPVAAGVSPAVEPGILPGGPTVPGNERPVPGGETPPSTSGGTPDTTAELLDLFRILTALRKAFLRLVAEKPGAETEAVLLADIALEDFAFVILSELMNACETVEANSAATLETQALILSLENLALSGVDPIESRALESELRAWGNLSASTARNELLRTKATLQRTRRLAEDFGTRTIGLLSERAEKLGRALGVAEYAIRVFSEADIRSHLVFQVSKLATGLSRCIRHRLKLPPWDVLVPGTVVGRATALDSLEAWVPDTQEPTVVLLKDAAGDEEIPGNIAGIVLGHGMPHLSHLAVRARQAGVVFIACEEPEHFNRVLSLDGQMVSLRASADTVVWEPKPQGTVTVSDDTLSHSEGERDGVRGRAQRANNPGKLLKNPRDAAWGHAAYRISSDSDLPCRPGAPTGRSPQTACVPLEQATLENSGGKAAGARRLLELSREKGAGFNAPAGLAIPFGVMEQALQAEMDYKQLLKDLNTLPPPEFEAATRRLRELVQDLRVPDAVLTKLRDSFSDQTALVVRSSANLEDTEQLAGAGLYESVINVSLSEVAAAVRRVWSSLWTQRAALSRRQAGIPPEEAHMAVLIQELVEPDFAFVLHTVNPITLDPKSLYAEIVVGLGETLVSAATAGEPYRLACDKPSETVTILAFANFSQALRSRAKALSPSLERRAPNPGSKPPAMGEPSSRSAELHSAVPQTSSLHPEPLDYSRIDFSRHPASLESLGRRLCRIGTFVEKAIGLPQDIEGVLAQDKVFLVQTRPQQGLSAGNQT